jgi:hypothetical protein
MIERKGKDDINIRIKNNMERKEKQEKLTFIISKDFCEHLNRRNNKSSIKFKKKTLLVLLSQWCTEISNKQRKQTVTET